MNITIEISGGFAATPGLSGPFSFDTKDIDPHIAKEIESLVSDSKFFELPAVVNITPTGAADYYTYTITVRDGIRSHSVRLADPVTDPSLERLVSRVRELVRPAGR
ncbi:MAG TPA: protealysin inhibitor emfourin [Kaistia sp.]|nr:protealysin inhibitor emfourin [Kaistia sp.]